MATVKLVHDKRYVKDKNLIDQATGEDNNTYPLKIRVYQGDLSRDISLGYDLRKDQWIENRITRLYLNSGRANASVQEKFSIALKVVSQYGKKLDNLSVDAVREIIVKEIDKKEENSVPDEIQEIVDNSLSKAESELWLGKFAAMVAERTRKKKQNGTAKWYEDAYAAIKNFNGGKDILIAKIGIGFLEDFEAHHLDKGNSINGIGAYLRAIRSLTNKAIKEVLKNKEYEGYPWGRRGYTIKTEKTKKRAVTKKVIDDIKALKPERGSAHWHAQNYLLFIFNNRGINLIDIAKFKKHQIENAVYRGKKLISGQLAYTRSKTKADLTMKLTPESIRILNDYNIFEKEKNDDVFPIGYVESKVGRATYDQKRKRINGRFKDLSADAGHPDVDMTSYVIRHTWGTQMKKNGASTEMIQDGFGHTDPRTSQIYTDVWEGSVIDEMNDKVVA